MKEKCINDVATDKEVGKCIETETIIKVHSVPSRNNVIHLAISATRKVSEHVFDVFNNSTVIKNERRITIVPVATSNKTALTIVYQTDESSLTVERITDIAQGLKKLMDTIMKVSYWLTISNDIIKDISTPGYERDKQKESSCTAKNETTVY